MTELSNNRRVAKNTLMLYFRMFITMAISLYTSRVVLQTLGVSDYGIYSVVGGFVSMVGFVQSMFVNATQRYMAYALGTGDNERVKTVFANAMVTETAIALFILLVAETFGLWFLNAKLNIDPDRMVAANYVYQAAVLSLVIKILSIPYDSCVIAHEHMQIYAYVSILEAVLRLVIVWVLVIIPFDKLISYSFLLVGVAITIRAIYVIYSRRHFEETRVKRAYKLFDKPLFQEMFMYSVWSLLGALGFSFKDQFSNMIQNIFCGTAVNAARGLSNHVIAAVNSFSSNFMTALTPQITKQYAAHNDEQFKFFVYNGAKMSFYLLSIICIPVITNIDYILNLWLTTVPQYTAIFIIISLASSLIYSFSSSITSAVKATGDIKWFEIGVTIILFAELPVAYLLLKRGYEPYIAMLPVLITQPLCLLFRFYILKRKEPSFSYSKYFVGIILRSVVVFGLGLGISFALVKVLPSNFLCFIINVLLSIVIYAILIFYLGFNKTERIWLLSFIKGAILKRRTL